MRARRSSSISVLLVCVATAACAAAPVAQARVESERVLVNGRAVHTAGNQSLLQVLRSAANPRRIGDELPPEQRPIVLLDGVMVRNGVAYLGQIPALQVESVTVLRNVEAIALHGPMARNGAILVTTRK
jgi:hypothetical protein